jgi:hypothetical protein
MCASHVPITSPTLMPSRFPCRFMPLSSAAIIPSRSLITCINTGMSLTNSCVHLRLSRRFCSHLPYVAMFRKQGYPNYNVSPARERQCRARVVSTGYVSNKIISHAKPPGEFSSSPVKDNIVSAHCSMYRLCMQRAFKPCVGGFCRRLPRLHDVLTSAIAHETNKIVSVMQLNFPNLQAFRLYLHKTPVTPHGLRREELQHRPAA